MSNINIIAVSVLLFLCCLFVVTLTYDRELKYNCSAKDIPINSTVDITEQCRKLRDKSGRI